MREFSRAPSASDRCAPLATRHGGKSVANAAQRPVLVTERTAAVAPITVSETGYLSIPHKDKFGRDYKPVPEDTGVYPVVRK